MYNTLAYAKAHFPNILKTTPNGTEYISEEHGRFPNAVNAELAVYGLKLATTDPKLGDRVVYAPLDGISIWATVEHPLLQHIVMEHNIHGERFVEEGIVYKLKTDDGRIIRPFKEDMTYDWNMYVPIPVNRNRSRSRSRSRRRRSRSRSRERTARNKNG